MIFNIIIKNQDSSIKFNIINNKANKYYKIISNSNQ